MCVGGGVQLFRVHVHRHAGERALSDCSGSAGCSPWQWGPRQRIACWPLLRLAVHVQASEVVAAVAELQRRKEALAGLQALGDAFGGAEPGLVAHLLRGGAQQAPEEGLGGGAGQAVAL